MAEDDIEIAAAELALGLTPCDDRAAATAREAREPAFANRVAAWERRLTLLAEAVSRSPDVAPPPELIDSIERRIDGAGAILPGTFTLRPDGHKWITVSAGVMAAVLMRNPRLQRKTVLLRCQPGAIYPTHEHAEDEELFLLEGDLVFSTVKLAAGDYHFAPKGRTHPDAYSPSGCLILVSAAA